LLVAYPLSSFEKNTKNVAKKKKNIAKKEAYDPIELIKFHPS
jgi:hypothetical protein